MMKTSEKVRRISPDPYCQECGDDVARLESALEYIVQFNDAAIAGNPTAIRKRAEAAIKASR